jgi:hypothetical protein
MVIFDEWFTLGVDSSGNGQRFPAFFDLANHG